MRLTHIKLAGFKSFVDPTTITVPGQLVAVIGPNGCGKSNVIDAVRWVLGESSAKQLRGESMQDVIFNGSSTRKPVSRASVELVFDNSDGALTGSWGQYAEVAIKRVLTRQGESSYYINNQQVRRRDITDLFLGTGVGARGYAVIEQGMISRIIEARPEELRAYLEEAAGISKYKERRRETEHRIADTRSNLERVADLQQELERQVERLAEQAEVAAQYHDLRSTLTHKQNLLALARREEAARHEAQARVELARLETEEAAAQSALSQLEVHIEQLREGHYSANDAVHHAQQRLAEANAQLARLEEAQRHLSQNRQRVERELASAQQERQLLAENQRQVDEELANWQPQHEEAQLALEEAQLILEDDTEQLPAAEKHFATQEQLLSLLSTQQANLARERDLSSQQLEHLRRTQLQLSERATALQQELNQLNLPDQASLTQAHTQVAQAQSALEAVRTRLQADEAKQADLIAEREKLDEQLSQQRSSQVQLQAQAAALHSLLQREAAGEQLSRWLEQQQLSQAPQLWQAVQITPRWQLALEAILGERLNARVAEVTKLSEHTPPASLTLVSHHTAVTTPPSKNWPRLLDELSATAPFDLALANWLSGVYLADDLATALSLQTQLNTGECLLTPEGHCLYANSIAWYAQAGDDGIMARKTQLETATQQLAQLQPLLTQNQQRREQLQQHSTLLGEAIRAQKGTLSRLENELNQVTLEQVKLDQAARQGAVRLAAIEQEQQTIHAEQTQAKERSSEAQLMYEEASLALEELTLQQEDLQQARAQASAQLEQARQQAREQERSLHTIKLSLATAAQKMAELQRRTQELQAREQQLSARQQNLLEEAESSADSLPAEALQAALEQREKGEQALSQQRDQLNGLTEQLRELSQQQQAVNARLPDVREARSASLLKHQEARLAMERYQEELATAEVDEAALLAELTPAVRPNALAGEIAKLARAVDGLGAVNLAALQELETAQQRGEYLASQADDLNQAMATLEQAMAKIDNESRAMLQSTYDAVNHKMSEFFPTLFGGGRAELVLTGEDLLDAGVQIIAQPPGKKNSTIHLLSGGEKALTAMSLVFSLFDLNPAPFCLLDEVDAPLDDANTGRFCELVKQMAQRTQFLYISHNRLTMEMAEQLVGVTMQEQGVSRIVAVDIVEALKMREV